MRQAELGRQAQALFEWAKQSGRVIQPSLADKAVAGGDEASVFHDAGSDRWVKFTKPNAFGHSVETFWGLDKDTGKLEPSDYALGQATPDGYLSRLQAANAMYGDDARLHGVFVKDGNLHVVTSQPNVRGATPEVSEIRTFMEADGFRPVDGASYYRESDNTFVADATPSNFKKVGGNVVPIDVVPHSPDDELRPVLQEKVRRFAAREANRASS